LAGKSIFKELETPSNSLKVASNWKNYTKTKSDIRVNPDRFMGMIMDIKAT
jgi:hypothetical protein